MFSVLACVAKVAIQTDTYCTTTVNIQVARAAAAVPLISTLYIPRSMYYYRGEVGGGFGTVLCAAGLAINHTQLPYGGGTCEDVHVGRCVYVYHPSHNLQFWQVFLCTAVPRKGGRV